MSAPHLLAKSIMLQDIDSPCALQLISKYITLNSFFQTNSTLNKIRRITAHPWSFMLEVFYCRVLIICLNQMLSLFFFRQGDGAYARNAYRFNFGRKRRPCSVSVHIIHTLWRVRQNIHCCEVFKNKGNKGYIRYINSRLDRADLQLFNHGGI